MTSGRLFLERTSATLQSQPFDLDAVAVLHPWIDRAQLFRRKFAHVFTRSDCNLHEFLELDSGASRNFGYSER